VGSTGDATDSYTVSSLQSLQLDPISSCIFIMGRS